MPTPIPDTNPTPTQPAPTPGAEATHSPNDPTPDDRNPPEKPPTIAPESMNESPAAATAATLSNPPAPTPDVTINPGEASTEPGEDNAGARTKKFPKRKRFRPSQAKTAQCASRHRFFYYYVYHIQGRV